MPDPVWYALSIKQPWAGLIIAGIKTVEIRTWDTSRRGTVLIHAARHPDPRPEGWSWVTTPELKKWTEPVGGIIGVAELVSCVRYDTRSVFEADQPRHCNAPDWFTPPLYGLVFRHARPLPFRPLPGKTFFFPVSGRTADAPELGKDAS
jgi:hypothetical protein